jgi:tetrapyrrole methylase family protein/MazG family protein
MIEPGEIPLVLVDGRALGGALVPPFPTSCNALILHIGAPGAAADAQAVLSALYPGEHTVWLVGTPGKPVEGDVSLAVSELREYAGGHALRQAAALYVPCLGADTSFEAFHQIVARLRAPDGCPWDREQTHASLRPHLLGETYETLAAMDAGDAAEMTEEFGDLLLQIILNAQIGSETGRFNIAAVLQGIHRKIVRRHPHVFGEVEVDGVGGVLRNWEKIKEAERKQNSLQEKPKGLLDGVPQSFPALAQAQEIQDRAARVKFDWDSIEPVWDKVLEEFAEVRGAETTVEREKELGDLLFAVVNLVRWYKADAESALRETNQRFRTRFAFIEQRARQHGRALSELSFQEMDAIWEEAKKER